MELKAVLQELLGECPGSLAVAIADPEGLPVTAVGSAAEAIDELAAEYSAVLKELERAERELEHGSVEQVAIRGRSLDVVLTSLPGGYFLIQVLAPEGLLGKAKFLAKVAAEKLRSEFA